MATIRRPTRFTKGIMVALADKVKRIDERVWEVQSETDEEKYYKVEKYDDGLKCECKDYEMGNVCKHCYAIILLETI